MKAAIVSVLALLALTACASGPPPCPTVEDDNTWTIDSGAIDPDVRAAFTVAVQGWLRDPASYEEVRVTANHESFITGESLILSRSDGSRYYSELQVHYRARNGFGGMNTGVATIKLRENAVEGCIVRDTYLWD